MDIDRKDGKIFCILKDKYLMETPEEKVRQEYIYKLINDYGYLPEQMDQEVTVSNSQRGQGKSRADIVIWKNKEAKATNKNAFIVVECKAENVKIHQEDYFQGANYASWAGANFFITTNQKETKYFSVDKGSLPKKLEEIIAIPHSSEINDERKIKDLLAQTKAFTRDEFTRLLFRCHNIIRNNDKLSPEAAFDEISKILFMKIRYEKDKQGSEVFTKKRFEQLESDYEKYTRDPMRKQGIDLPFMQVLFNDTKDNYKEDKLFEVNEQIKIRQVSFEAILEELQKYNLSDTSDDVKGIAFEEFLGKTFRGELGQFFTPRTIVDFMTAVLDPKEGETICDPTCGSGGFLIKSFEYIRDKIESNIQTAKDEIKTKLMGDDYDNFSEKEQNTINSNINKIFAILNKELESDREKSRLNNLSYNCIYGTDANPRMARTSKMNMIMHGDGHGGVHHHDGLLNVNGIFEERFDVILTNPPFGARIDKDLKITQDDVFTDEVMIEKYTNKYGDAYNKALSQVNDNIQKPVLSLFDLGKMSGLTEVLFMERCLRLLKKGGRMGIVLPEGVLNTSNLQKVRDYFESKAKIILICSIPQDVFIAAGATVKPSLVFMKRFTEQEEKEYEKAVKKALEQCQATYQEELNIIKNELDNATTATQKRLLNKKIAEIEKKIEEDTKPIVKQLFDYEIPIAKVDKAGITTTGGVCKNELLDVLKEFREYNMQAKLWEINTHQVSYVLSPDNMVLRRLNGIEEELTW